MSDAITVQRFDIRLTEERIPTSFVDDEAEWWAVFDGYLSTGESARIGRRASTSAEALAKLEEAIREQGWTIESEVAP